MKNCRKPKTKKKRNTILMNDLPIGIFGDKQKLTGANKKYVILHKSWEDQGVDLSATIDASFQYNGDQIELVVVVNDEDPRLVDMSCRPISGVTLIVSHSRPRSREASLLELALELEGQ